MKFQLCFREIHLHDGHTISSSPGHDPSGFIISSSFSATVNTPHFGQIPTPIVSTIIFHSHTFMMSLSKFTLNVSTFEALEHPRHITRVLHSPNRVGRVVDVINIHRPTSHVMLGAAFWTLLVSSGVWHLITSRFRCLGLNIAPSRRNTHPPSANTTDNYCP